jgi:hypothetical protein
LVLINNVKIVTGLNGWLMIEFNDTVIKLVNIIPMMSGVLVKLKDQSFFEKVFVDQELKTISWPGELDLDPDNLYQNGIDLENVKYLLQAIKKNNEFSKFVDREIV